VAVIASFVGNSSDTRGAISGATTVAAIASEETGVEPWIRMVATRTEEQRLFASSIISVLDELRSAGS
jgi:hypothetical protein